MNLIKKVCRDQKLSYAQLAKEIGYGEDTIKKSASSGKLSKPLEKAIELFLKSKSLEEELNLFSQLKLILTKIVK